MKNLKYCQNFIVVLTFPLWKHPLHLRHVDHSHEINYPSNHARRGWKLLRTAIMVMMLFNVKRSFRGMIPWRILNVFMRRIALSTCILTTAMRRERTSTLWLRRWPWLNAGMFRVHFRGRSRWRMLNPLSAITSSPSSRRSSNPLLSVIWASLMHPVYSLERNVTVPVGETPTRSLNVFECV